MKIRVEVEVGPTELREFLGLPDVATVQQEALGALAQRLRSGAATSADLAAVFRGMLPESLAALGDLPRMVARAVQSGRPVSVETTVAPEGAKGGKRRPTDGPRKKRAAGPKAR